MSVSESDYRALKPCEEALPANRDELLFRQIPEHLWDAQQSRPLSHAFGPSEADQGMASHSRSSRVTAQDAKDWHNKRAKKPSSRSQAVFAVNANSLVDSSLRAVDDGNCPEEPEHERATGHCYVDYRHLDKRQERRARGVLFAAAIKRGPESTT